MTAQRPQARAVRQALAVLDHPTADEVFRHVRRRIPRVSLATVYRNLDGLVAQGDLQVRHVGATKRYDPRTEPHAHLHCTRCDRLTDVPLRDGLLDVLRSMARDAGMDFENALLELRVRCPECKENRP